MERLFFLALVVISLSWPLQGATVLSGRASVIDGDTIEIHGQRIRFFGIHAPESHQTCEADQQTYRCGQQAALALADRIGQQTVSCEKHDVDRYGRVVAVCRAGGKDLNAWMVSQGWALAYRHYSTAYVGEEDAAHAAHLGIWRGPFTAPWTGGEVTGLRRSSNRRLRRRRRVRLRRPPIRLRPPAARFARRARPAGTAASAERRPATSRRGAHAMRDRTTLRNRGRLSLFPLILLGGSLCSMTSDAAGITDGNSLLSTCTEDPTHATYSHGECLGYIEAVIQILLNGGAVGDWRACLPGNGTIGQAKDVVLKSLRDHPEQRHFAAAGLIAAALHEAFPCP
jgi:endonuclease YncB( thermonuclease family)